MLKTFKSIMYIAAAAMAFTACNVEPVETPEVTTGTHKVTFVASQVDTKTSMEINDGVASFDWEEADVDYFHIFENDYSNKATEYAADIDENGAMQLMATFENGGTAPFTYFGFFAPTFFTYPTVPSAQTDNGKYDQKADILIAKPVTAEASQSEEILSFQFKRIVAINVMTLKGLTAGETVSEVKIVSDKPIAGKYDHTKDEWYNSTDFQITVSANSVVNDKGEAVIYFVCAPVEEAQLTITATTAAGKTYSKELAKTISFTEGGVKTFGVTMEEEITLIEDFSSSNASENYYDCASSLSTADNRSDFNYSWVPEGSGTVFNNGIKLGASKATGSVSSTDIISDIPSGTKFTVKIYAAVWNNDGGKLVVSYDGPGEAKDAANDRITETADVEYSADAFTKSTDFVFTKSSDQTLALKVASSDKRILIDKIEIVYFGKPVKPISVTGVSIDKPAITLEVGETKNLVATVAPADATNKTINWSSDNNSVATVEDGAVIAVGVGTANITVTTVDGGFTATCNVTVKAAPVKVYSSLAELLADGEPTEAGTPVTVTLTDEVIESIYVTSSGYRNGVYLKVPNKKVEIYCYDVPETWEAFGKISGTLEDCTWKKFGSTWELLPENWNAFDYAAPVKYNVVIPTGLVGGTISATPVEAPAGATVTLTATPATGYQFVSWSVQDALENDVTVTNNTFTMPASDVTVSAVFEEKEDGGSSTTSKLELSSSKKFSTTSGSTLSDDKGNVWTCTGNNIQNSYQSTYSGQQFGTSNTNNVYTFTSPFSGKTISSITIIAAAGGTTATYLIKVGDTVYKSGNLSKTSTEYTCTVNASGSISVILDQNSGGKAVYLNSIIVSYN